MKLTQKVVDETRYEGRSRVGKGGRKRWSRHVLWDDRLPGLGLRISHTNRKSYFISYREDGRRRPARRSRAQFSLHGIRRAKTSRAMKDASARGAARDARPARSQSNQPTITDG